MFIEGLHMMGDLYLTRVVRFELKTLMAEFFLKFGKSNFIFLDIFALFYIETYSNYVRFAGSNL